jgi:hypothetical protein
MARRAMHLNYAGTSAAVPPAAAVDRAELAPGLRAHWLAGHYRLERVRQFAWRLRWDDGHVVGTINLSVFRCHPCGTDLDRRTLTVKQVEVEAPAAEIQKKTGVQH